MIEIIGSPLLNSIPRIQHGMFTRNGGVSTGCYSSLNCNYESGDKLANVKENRRRAMSYIGHSIESLVSVNCVHGKETIIVKKLWQEQDKPNADAMVTDQAGIVLGSDSADCPIILFADENAGVIGWAHAGWRGAKAGVVEETVKKMLHIGAKSHNISAVVCPSIAQESYETGPEFYDQFIDDNADNQRYFKHTEKSGYALFDLKSYVRNRLLNLHLKAISIIELDTYTNEDCFFSCRRSYHQGNKKYGGNLSFIVLNNK